VVRISTTIFLGLLFLGGLDIESAKAGEATLTMTNNAPFTIMIKFFSRSRNAIWPGPTQHYTLDDDAPHDFPLACVNGERICYGGSYNANDTPRFWGVGFRGDKGCNRCCIICGDNVSHAWRLTE
jgi:hypothetical protein